MRLFAFERRWAEVLFEAFLPGDTPGWKPGATGSSEFWRCLDERTAPTFGPGLRVLVWAGTWLPLLHPRYLRPFHRLTADQREALLTSVAADERYLPRQAVATLKMIACFAYFDARKALT